MDAKRSPSFCGPLVTTSLYAFLGSSPHSQVSSKAVICADGVEDCPLRFACADRYHNSIAACSGQNPSSVYGEQSSEGLPRNRVWRATHVDPRINPRRDSSSILVFHPNADRMLHIRLAPGNEDTCSKPNSYWLIEVRNM